MLKRDTTQQHLFLLAVLGLGLALVLSPGPSQPVAHAAGLSLAARAEGGPSPELSGGQVSLFGRVIDPQGEPVRGAKVSLVLNGTPLGAVRKTNTRLPCPKASPTEPLWWICRPGGWAPSRPWC